MSDKANAAIRSLSSSLMVNWKASKTGYAAFTELFEQHGVAGLDGETFIQTLGALCGEEGHGSLIDITGTGRRKERHSWHQDSGPRLNEDGQLRKLSFTLQLSNPDDYEGGYFQWLEPDHAFDRMLDNATIDMTDAIKTLPYSVKEKGSIFFFPSFVHHQVTPVTRGQRKSFVGWCVGNQYV